jgi:predicted Rossmann-fold nucleotide-binding protein
MKIKKLVFRGVKFAINTAFLANRCLMDLMSEQHNIIRHNIDGLPYDENSVLLREDFLRKYGLGDDWINRIFITNFAGSRPGNKPIYVQEALNYSALMQAHNYGLVYGGMPIRTPGTEKFGVMNATAHHIQKYILSASPSLLADKFGPGAGLNINAVNFGVQDFYPRKVVMGLCSHRTVTHAGGYGTLEEVIEDIIYAVLRGRETDIISINGFWGGFLELLQVLKDIGLLNKKYLDVLTVSPNAQIAFDQAKRYFSDPENIQKIDSKYRDENRPRRNRPRQSLHDFLKTNPHFVSDHVHKFLSDEGRNAPRIGVVTSGHIRLDYDQSHLKDQRLTREFCAHAEKLGRNAAKGHAAIVLAGGKYGLRQVIADAALAEGGSVIWIERDRSTTLPCEVSSSGRELFMKVTREHEKSMLFDVITHATGFLPGGIHTLDRVFEIVTREQTGFGRFTSLLEDRNPSPVKCPVIGYNIGGLWTPIDYQVKRFLEDAFIDPEDGRLFEMVAPNENLAQRLIENANYVCREHRDVLEAISALPRRTDASPIPPVATARDPQ